MTAQEIASNSPQYVQVGFQIIGIASAIAAMTPTPKDDGILFVAKKLLDFIACNFRHARNEK